VIWFVTGTDTGVGKTVATAAVVVSLQELGRSPYVVKPAQTGVTPTEAGDLDEVRRLVGEVAGHEGVRLLAPLAPDTAARLEGVRLPGLLDHRDAIVEAAVSHDVVVEGAGGVLVPLGEHWTLLDLARSVELVTGEVGFVVVARSGLGTLNHAALTTQAIQARGLPVLGIVIGSWPAQPDLAEENNLTDLPAITGVPLLGRIPEGAGARSTTAFTAEAGTWLSLPL
jgi:dethiobiotin synthetase